MGTGMTDFLRDVLRDHIHLVSIVPDGPITGRHFGSDHEAAWAWARSENARGANIHFTVNRVREGVHKKSTKDDIVGVRFAHSDIDPPKDGSVWDKEAVLIDILTRGEPSFVIDSGNGWQPLWSLSDEPTDVESLNRGIDAVFASDKCHNIDRVLRLPGLINYPDAKKRSLGRVAVPTALVYESGEFHSSASISARFPYVPPPPSEAVEIELGNWQIETPESLNLNSRIVSMLDADIGQGERSEHAYRITAEMIGANYTNEQIVGLLMNESWSWSGTIHDQADPLRQATRKIKRAVEAGVKRPSEAFSSVPAPAVAHVLPEPPKLTRLKEAGFEPRVGATNGIMFEDQQAQHFKNCVYVTSLNKVLMPNGATLTQPKFDTERGGYDFMYSLDGKKTTRSAWDAFTVNPLFKAPIADDMCFRPESPSFSLIQEGNWTLVNAYVPVETPKTPGDPSKFLDWLQRVLPVERDRKILLSYCAAIIQNLGRKAQWWPVLIGTKGNGKTLLLSCVMFAIGYQYSHLLNTSKMTRNGINFNGWMRNKLFLGLEEIYSAGRRDFLEEFKPYVTNRRLPIEAKGEDEYTGDNRANGIMLTNHLDGVPIDPDERRYAPFITKQETEEDCIRDGLTSAYFSDLWAWLDGNGAYAQHGPDYGFRVVNHYLHTYVPVPEFDPFQGATRRPKTSCFERAVEAGRGGVEQEVLAAIDEDRVGFAGGWVSSKYLDDLIERSRVRVPRNKRRDLMKSIGYDWHPGLELGKATAIVQPDGIRSKLYVKIGTPQEALTEPGAICRAYTQAQIETKLGS